jgi:hypothetical protein
MNWDDGGMSKIVRRCRTVLREIEQAYGTSSNLKPAEAADLPP